MGELSYQRTVIAYHGCDESVVTDVLLRGQQLKASANDYDWLGRGIYFWEHGPQRALEWARQRRDIAKPAVLGAFLHLGNCFDLVLTACTRRLGEIYERYRHHCDQRRIPIPQNLPAQGEAGSDLVLRYLDCAVLNWGLDFLEHEVGLCFHTVRGVFTEGQPAFPGSRIMAKSHIQVAVRDASVIIGSFKPSVDSLAV